MTNAPKRVKSSNKRRRKKKKNTYIFATHGFEHLLQLDSELLDVVDQDAGLHTQKKNVLFTSTKQAVTNASI